MTSTAPAPDGWRREDASATTQFSVAFMLLVVVGVVFLWLVVPVLGLWMMGDCADPPSAACAEYRDSVQGWARVVAAVLLANTAAGAIAFFGGARRWAVGLLLLVSTATLGLCLVSFIVPNGSGTILHPLLPLLVPGALVLTFGSGWRLWRLRAAAASPAVLT
jgi:hypothetical protein